MKKNKKRVLFFGVCTFLSFIALWLFLTIEGFPGHKGLQIFLNEKLMSNEPFPAEFNDAQSKAKRVIYILGGGRKSLKHKFKTAADLYQRSVAGKILILSEPGITEYDASIRRNLTNDEWAFKRLTGLGVKREDIEPLSLEKGLFGTLKEARRVSQVVSERNYNVLILVCSPYHSMRVKVAFSQFLRNNKVNVFVYPSDDSSDLYGLLFEYSKFIVYKNFLLNKPIKAIHGEG